MVHNLLTRIRRNHGLEHATIHMISRRMPNVSLIGMSDWNGFSLIGIVDTSLVEKAATEALARLQNGERHLAVHPRCGTVLATIGVMAGLASFLIFFSVRRSESRKRWSALPEVLLAAISATVIAQPLGLWLQERITVSGDPANMQIASITQQQIGELIVHRVDTAE